jgi:hypothetical protein
MNGRLILNFANGYAPQSGDEFTLLEASAFSGDPEVVISGLEPGFEFSLAFSGGALRLTALNDGVPATGPQNSTIYLPFIIRSGW